MDDHRPRRRLPLAVKLVAAAMLLVSLAAVVSGAVGVTLLRHYLNAQADRELRSYAADLVDGSFVTRPVFGGPGTAGLTTTGISVEVVDPGGHELVRPGSGPAGVPVSPAWITSHIGQLVTVPGPGGRGSWRVIVRTVRYTAHHIPFVYGAQDVSIVVSARDLPGLPGLIVVGMNLAAISDAIHRFALDDLLVAAVVLLLLAVAGIWLLHSALRPLRLVGEAPAGAPPRPAVPGGPGAGLDGLGQAVRSALARTGEAHGPAAARAQAARAAEERLRQELIGAGGRLRRSLSVIHGFARYYRSGHVPGPASLDRMMERVADEAGHMAAAADRLLRAAEPGWAADGERAAEPGWAADGERATEPG